MVTLIHDLLDMNVSNKDKEVFYSLNKIYSMKDVKERSIQISHFLSKNGIKKGDRVLIFSENSLDIIHILFGISRVGAVTVIVNEMTKPDNLSYIINNCNPSLILYNKVETVLDSKLKSINIEDLNSYIQFEEKEKLLNISINENDIALLIYTSASTGKPKGIISTHKNITFCVKSITNLIEIDENDVIGVFLPLSFDYGLYQIFISCYKGCSLALFTPTDVNSNIINLINKFNVTILPSTPLLIKILIKIRNRMTDKNISLKKITSTGEHLDIKIIKEIKSAIKGVKVYPMYGLTECKRVSILDESKVYSKPNSVGKPMPLVYCDIIDENGNVLPPNNIGFLKVRGKNVMQGYWKGGNLNDEIFLKQEDMNTLYTKDLFRMDEEGYLYFEGRTGDIFKKNDFRISKKEIESKVLELKLGTEAVLIPPIDSNDKTFLFIKSTFSKTYIYKKLREKLEYYKIPDNIKVINNIPKTVNQKIDVNALKNMK